MTERSLPDRKGTLPPGRQEPEVEHVAARFRCDGCKTVYEIGMSGRTLSRKEPSLIGRYQCDCGFRIAFEFLRDDTIRVREPLASPDVSSGDVFRLFDEAALAYWALAYGASLIMARACVEASLKEKNVPGYGLKEIISNAEKSNLLDARQVTQAESAKLYGDDIVHNLLTVTQLEALLALHATVQLVEHIARQAPLPATQSGKGSNAP